MEDFLYIILAIGWLVWTLYSNKVKQDKKRAEQAEMKRAMQQREAEQYAGTPAPADTMPEMSIPPVYKRPERTIFEELFGGEVVQRNEAEEEEYTPEIDERGWQERMREYSDQEQASLEEIKDEVPADYFERQYQSRDNIVSQTVSSVEEKQEDDNFIEEFMEDFDLRKAVIYNEILRAPYISE
jgi:hypothetical protein